MDPCDPRQVTRVLRCHSPPLPLPPIRASWADTHHPPPQGIPLPQANYSSRTSLGETSLRPPNMDHPKWGHPRLWARLPKSVHNPMGGGRGGALPQSSNPDNMAAGERGEGGGGERGGLQQITAHSNSCPSFPLSFCPLCIRRGFDKNLQCRTPLIYLNVEY
jgi:hypothetical protein